MISKKFSDVTLSQMVINQSFKLQLVNCFNGMRFSFQLKKLYSSSSEAAALNDSLMKSRDCTLSFLNQTNSDLVPASIFGSPEVKSEPALNQTLTLAAVVEQQEGSPRYTKSWRVITFSILHFCGYLLFRIETNRNEIYINLHLYQLIYLK